jgi:hypothetical protein
MWIITAIRVNAGDAPVSSRVNAAMCARNSASYSLISDGWVASSAATISSMSSAAAAICSTVVWSKPWR